MAQYQIAWSLREAVVDRQDLEPLKSWADIGNAIACPARPPGGSSRSAARWSPSSPTSPPNSPLSDSQPQPFTADNAIYAFSDQAGNWFGPAEALERAVQQRQAWERAR